MKQPQEKQRVAEKKNPVSGLRAAPKLKAAERLRQDRQEAMETKPKKRPPSKGRDGQESKGKKFKKGM